MNEEAERRIEEARQKAAREQETAEFLKGLTSNDVVARQIHNPEAWIMRDKAKSAALNGKLPTTQCTHPLDLLRQYIDDDPGMKREGRPVNLFECAVCHTLVWFVDPWGVAISDE